MPPTELERTACHEAAHFVASLVLRPDSEPLDVSIQRIGDTLGHCAIVLSEEEMDASEDQSRRIIIMFFAGKAAEIELLGIPVEDTQAGAASDDAGAELFLSYLGLTDDMATAEKTRLYQDACDLVLSGARRDLEKGWRVDRARSTQATR